MGHLSPRHRHNLAFDKIPGLKDPDVRPAGNCRVFYGQGIISWRLHAVHKRRRKPSPEIIVFQAHMTLVRQGVTHGPGRTGNGKRAGHARRGCRNPGADTMVPVDAAGSKPPYARPRACPARTRRPDPPVISGAVRKRADCPGGRIHCRIGKNDRSK